MIDAAKVEKIKAKYDFQDILKKGGISKDDARRILGMAAVSIVDVYHLGFGGPRKAYTHEVIAGKLSEVQELTLSCAKAVVRHLPEIKKIVTDHALVMPEDHPAVSSQAREMLDEIIRISKIEAKKTKSSVMKRAWELARQGVKKFGGKIKDYFRSALSMAWAEV